MTKEKIIEELQNGFDEVITTAQPVSDSVFFKRPDSKWSIAENLEHLILAIKPLNLAFRLPKISLLYFGTPNRPIRNYNELVLKYKAKLDSGGRASSAFVPKLKLTDKQALIVSFKEENKKFVSSLEKWSEADLDRYLLPHPLLGKLYLREMLYFKIYHTQHHLRSLERLL